MPDRSGGPNRSIFGRTALGYDLAVSPAPDGPAPADRPVRRAAIANLGCKVNQSEMDEVERLLRARGVELVSAHGEPADLVVVNTCTVTAIADRKSRQAIRRARRGNPGAVVIVTGCAVTVDPEAMAAVDRGARLYDNESKSRLASELASLLDLAERRPMPTLSGVEPAGGAAPQAPARAVESEGARAFELEPNESVEAGGEDGFTEAAIDRTRAFVKIQDGCSFHCTYCIIPRARGPERSMPVDEVLGQVRRSLAGGHREIVLTGINAGTYEDGGLRLPGLVRRILAETTVERIRLSSIEPQHVTDELLAVWTGSGGRCLPHFHVPLQSGDDAILRRMGRRYDGAAYRGLVGRLRRAIPEVAIHADLIVGFPGEDEAAWGRTAGLLRELSLAGVHVFRYSARPGTPAARMMGQVDGRTKKRRAAEALAIAADLRAAFARTQLGREVRVLFERRHPDGRWIGHAESHVLVAAEPPDDRSLENAVGLVRVESIDPAATDRLTGRLLSVDRPIDRADEPMAQPPAK
jgi:threonylcarbamoyladenosine tRNA methylthiotransferase MtaB